MSYSCACLEMKKYADRRRTNLLDLSRAKAYAGVTAGRLFELVTRERDIIRGVYQMSRILSQCLVLRSKLYICSGPNVVSTTEAIQKA